jgi:hypothetical protein
MPLGTFAEEEIGVLPADDTPIPEEVLPFQGIKLRVPS